MRKIFPIVYLMLLLAGCANTANVGQPTSMPVPPPTSAPKVAPTSEPSLQPTAAPTNEPTVVPTSAPTAAPTEAPTIEATTTAPLESTAAPVVGGVALPAGPLDAQAQARALLPQFSGDLNRANEWNRYTIAATIDPDARTLSGRERLEYTNRDTVPLDRIYFHLYPNLPDLGGQIDVSNVLVKDQTVDVVYETRRYLARVNLPRPLEPGATTSVEFDFTTKVPAGVGEKLYGAFNRDPGLFSLASSYPIVAMVRGGNWDIGWPDGRGDLVNSETALYDVTLAAPADWQIVTTGVVVDGRLDARQQVARIVSGPQRDFMIAATQYQVVSSEVEGTKINSYFRPQHATGGQTVLQAAVDSLRIYNRRYGPYPLAELDLVEVSAGTFLGVEYPGLIEMQDKLYATGEGLAITVAHEVAHQWWYSIVGNDVQNEAWLDEAMASYSQIIYQEEVNGPDAAERELEGFRERYRRALAAGRDAPIEQPNTAFTGSYVLLVYGKAVLFFQALRDQIGEDAFDRFLHAHYANHRYAYITGTDLLTDAEGACSCDLDKLYQDWITTAASVEIP